MSDGRPQASTQLTKIEMLSPKYYGLSLQTANQMPIYRLFKEREGLQEKGRVYKNAVIAFMEATNYMQVRDAEIHPSLDDIQFRHKGSGDLAFAEAKGSKLSPNDFPSELARYYLEYVHRPEDQRFEFFIFAEELSNESLWNKLFERSYAGNDTIEEFLSKLENKLDDEDLQQKVADTTVEDFETFALDTHVHVGTYGELMTLAEELEDSERFDYEPYLHSFKPITKQHEYTTNLFQIQSYPDTLYRFDAIDEIEEAKVYNYNNDHYPVAPHAGTIYSLVDVDELPRGTEYYVKPETKEELDFETWLSEQDSPDMIDVAKELLLGVVSIAAQQNDCVVERSGGLYIYPIFRPKHRQRGERTLDGKWLAKELESYSEIRHRAVTVRVKRFANQYYYALRATQEFTSNGYTKVTGERKSDLQNTFSPNNFQGQNGKHLRQIQMWPKLLKLNSNTGLARWTDGGQYPATQQIQATQVDGLTLGVRPPTDGVEQSRIINGVMDGE